MSRIVMLVLMAGLLGCTSTVVPPVNPADPVTVFVLREAMHIGVVLPPDLDADAESNPREFIEYGFGDWGWFALDDTGSCSSVLAALWPTQGALGRRAFGATTEEELRKIAYWVELLPVVVSREKANALRHRLQVAFDGANELLLDRPNLGFKFVPYEVSYWFPQTCADEAADWLRELDCSVWWTPIRISLAVE